MYNGDFDDFMDAKHDEWCADCSLIAKEIDEEELDDYVPGGEGHLEIIYDRRNEK
jgi:hypothetical protein